MGCKVVRIGDIAAINANQYSVREAWQHIQYLDTGNVTRGCISSLQQLDPSSDKVPSRARRKVKPNSIVYSMVRPNQEHYAILDNPPEDMLVSTGFAVIDADCRVVSPGYLYYALTTKTTTDYFQALAEQSVSTYPTLSASDLESYAIPLPSIDRQKQIEKALNDLDAKIALNTKLNGYLLELLKASAKNLYKEYERNEELELPAGWRWIEVDEISEMVCRGITPKYNPNSDETVLGQTCVRNNLVLLENGRPHSPKKVTEKWLQKYDLLINSTGVGSLGRTAQIWFEPAKLVVDSHVTIVRCKDEKHALYLGFWAFEHEKYIESLHTGSTGQTELPRDHVKAIRLVLPSDESLERFNKMSEPSVRLIAANQEENKRLADLRDALLPKLVSGEIDVSKIDLAKLNSHLA